MENPLVTTARLALKTYSPGDLLALADLHDVLGALAGVFEGHEIGRSTEQICGDIALQLSKGSYELDAKTVEEIGELLDHMEHESPTEGGFPLSGANTSSEKTSESEYLEIFQLEMQDRISRSQDLVLDIEKTGDEASCQELFRIFHTVKGEAGFLRIQWLQELFHALESLLDAIRHKQIEMNPAIVASLFEGLDLTETFSNQGFLESPALRERITRILENVEGHLAGEISSSVTGKLSLPLEGGEVASASKTADSLIKVSGNKLSKLYDLVSEMLILQDQLKEESKVASQLRKVSREVQQSAMNLSTTTLKPLFVKMRRAVRDLARQQNKDVTVIVEGEALEIDRSLVEALEEPLIHLVRNCVGHGVESSDIRRSRGKPESGTVRLRGELRGNRIILTVGDDGGGLERDKILSAALKSEIVTRERAEEMTDDQIYKLIFCDGLSTAEKLDDISGRGVGMSIVKKTVERFRGALEIDTKQGEFTAFRLIFPLSSALVDGVMVEFHGGKYILPVENVLESIVVREELIRERENGMRVFQQRGEILPVFDLRKRFFGASQEAQNGLLVGVVVETTLGKRCVFIVQRVLDKKEFVIKSLGTRFRSLEGVGAAAILRDGEIGFLVDIDGVTAKS